MKTRFWALHVVAATLCAVSVDAQAQDAVTVESKIVFGGLTICSVGVFVSNTTPIVAFYLPLEIRRVASGPYIAPTGGPISLIWKLAPGNRVWYSPLGPIPTPDWPEGEVVLEKYADTAEFIAPCSGPPSHTFYSPSGYVDFVSPDAVAIACLSTGDANSGDQVTLDPGADPPGTENASILLVAGIGLNTPQYGTIEIDTCCIYPSGHLFFVDANYSQFAPAFTSGGIIVRCHHGNPSCDGTHDALDVVWVSNRAFRGYDALNDPSCPAHGISVDGLTDLNCDNTTNVVDLVSMVAVAFRNADPATLICDPCP